MIMLPRILFRARRDLGRKQVHDRPVLISGPNGSVLTEKTCSGTLLTAKTKRTVEKPRHKPFESNRYFAQPAAKLVHHPIDHAAADQCFANGDVSRPLRPMGK